MARGRGMDSGRTAARRAASDGSAPWRERGDALRIDDWTTQARKLIAAGAAPGDEYFVYLHTADLQALIDRYPPMDADGDHLGAISQWRFGHSVAANNGSDIWVVMRIPMATPDGEVAQVNAAARVANIENERVDDESARSWGVHSLLYRVRPSEAVRIFRERNDGSVVEITRQRQPRA